MSETVKINLTSERLEGALNNINYRQTERAMELMWHLYSHLDPIGLKPEELPIELFISYEKWVGSLSRRILHEHKSVYAEVDHRETNG
jgi:Txe/YoeB family toxin of Txe-Axe toxin-antitoxin module